MSQATDLGYTQAATVTIRPATAYTSGHRICAGQSPSATGGREGSPGTMASDPLRLVSVDVHVPY
jgi:hypothetical protein